MSWGRAPALAVDNEEGGGPGLRAAFRLPSGVEEEVMVATIGGSEAICCATGREGCGTGICWLKSSPWVETGAEETL